MQHIIQFAFDFDDDTIKQTIQEIAKEEVIKRITQDIETQMFETSFRNIMPDPRRDPLKAWIEDIVRDEIIKYKDEIISQSVANVSEAIKRTKAFKESVETISQNTKQHK